MGDPINATATTWQGSYIVLKDAASYRALCANATAQYWDELRMQKTYSNVVFDGILYIWVH